MCGYSVLYIDICVNEVMLYPPILCSICNIELSLHHYYLSSDKGQDFSVLYGTLPTMTCGNCDIFAFLYSVILLKVVL